MCTPQTRDNTDRNVFADNLPSELTEEEFRELFSKFGTITGIKFLKHKTGQRTGYGFVEYETEEAGREAVESLNKTEIRGHIIRVSKAQPPQHRLSDTNLYVEGIPRCWTNVDLKTLFEPYGEVEGGRVLIDKSSDGTLNTGVGFVHFKRGEDAREAINSVSGQALADYPDHIIKVKFAKLSKRQKVQRFKQGMHTNGDLFKFYNQGICRRPKDVFYAHIDPESIKYFANCLGRRTDSIDELPGTYPPKHYSNPTASSWPGGPQGPPGPPGQWDEDSWRLGYNTLPTPYTNRSYGGMPGSSPPPMGPPPSWMTNTMGGRGGMGGRGMGDYGGRGSYSSRDDPQNFPPPPMHNRQYGGKPASDWSPVHQMPNSSSAPSRYGDYPSKGQGWMPNGPGPGRGMRPEEKQNGPVRNGPMPPMSNGPQRNGSPPPSARGMPPMDSPNDMGGGMQGNWPMGPGPGPGPNNQYDPTYSGPGPSQYAPGPPQMGPDQMGPKPPQMGPPPAQMGPPRPESPNQYGPPPGPVDEFGAPRYPNNPGPGPGPGPDRQLHSQMGPPPVDHQDSRWNGGGAQWY